MIKFLIFFLALTSMGHAQDNSSCINSCYHQTGDWVGCFKECSNQKPMTYDPSEYDYACVSVCTQQGNDYNYCLKQCSY